MNITDISKIKIWTMCLWILLSFSVPSFIYSASSVLDDPFLLELIGEEEEKDDVASFPGHPSTSSYQHPYSPYKDPDYSSNNITQTAESLEDGIVINFENVEIIAYLRWISNLIGVNFIFEESDLDFKVTIVSNEPATRKNIMASLLQILRIHELSLLEQGNNIIIHKSSSEVGSGSSVLLTEGESISPNSAIVTKVFQLHHTNPSSISGALQPMLSSKALIETADDTRHLIITDLAINIEKASILLKALDTPNNTLDIGIYKVKSMNIASLVALAERIVEPLSNNNTLVLVPQPGAQTIFIVSTPYLIEKILSVLTTLDVNRGSTHKGKDPFSQPGSEQEADYSSYESYEDLPPGHIDSTQFKNFELQYRHGAEIENALTKIGDSLSLAGSANQDLVSAIQTIEWIASTNSLVFTGSSKAIKKLEDLIQSLDIPTKEVLIEMLVIETTVSNSLQFGVQVGYRDTGSRFGSAGNFISPEVSDGLDSVTFDGIPDATSLMNPGGFSLGVLGKAIVNDDGTFTSIGALVKALNKDGDTRIIMNPQLVVQNNSTAEQFVGTTDRFASTSIQSVEGSFAETNYEYRQIGSRISVTPTLTNSDIITLDIDQRIQVAINASNTDDSTDSTLPLGPIATTKSIRTRVHIPNKYFLILSGMINEQTTKSKTKVPCLGNMAGIGGAFSQTDTSSNRYNMMIFIRPHIISTPEEMRKITKQQKDRIQKNSKTFNKEFEEESLLDLLNL
jgi:type III secretion protein C